MISAEIPDYSRERPRAFWDPSRKLIQSIRRYQRWKKKRGPMAILFSKFAVLQHRFWSMVTSSDIPISSKIAGGLLLPHPIGIVLHPDSSIGPNCMLLQHVTLVKGVKLLGHVDIGAGAKVIKSVTIGKHAKIGANAVVISDVPDYATAVGIPARIINHELHIEGDMSEFNYPPLSIKEPL